MQGSYKNSGHGAPHVNRILVPIRSPNASRLSARRPSLEYGYPTFQVDMGL